MKAYRALAETVELPPVDIFLRKIIPDGAGLEADRPMRHLRSAGSTSFSLSDFPTAGLLK